MVLGKTGLYMWKNEDGSPSNSVHKSKFEIIKT